MALPLLAALPLWAKLLGGAAAGAAAGGMAAGAQGGDWKKGAGKGALMGAAALPLLASGGGGGAAAGASKVGAGVASAAEGAAAAAPVASTAAASGSAAGWSPLLKEAGTQAALAGAQQAAQPTVEQTTPGQSALGAVDFSALEKLQQEADRQQQVQFAQMPPMSDMAAPQQKYWWLT